MLRHLSQASFLFCMPLPCNRVTDRRDGGMAMVSRLACNGAASFASAPPAINEAAPWRLRPCSFSCSAPRRRRFSVHASSNWSPDALTDADLRDFTTWLKQQGLPDQIVELRQSNVEEVGCFTTQDLKAGNLAIKVPENYTVTCTDVANHPVISQLAAGRPDLIGLSLWLIYERWLGAKSLWHPYLRTFPSTTLSPVAWSKEEQETLLKGTSVIEEVKQRCLFLEDEYNDIMELSQSKLKDLPQGVFTLEKFKIAFSVILSRAIYLPSAELYALVPFGDAVNLSGECETAFEYSTEAQSVVLRVDKNYTSGQQVFASYGQNRPNSDLFISCGLVDEKNKNDFIEIEVGLVKTDPLRLLKLQILQAASFQDEQTFPLYLDRFPTQLLSYMRLARLQDSGLIAKIAFDKDIIVNEANEYEVLTLLLNECRNRLLNFDRSLDDEYRLLNSKDVSPKERVAAKLRVCEQKILGNTMAALRTRLAPIRGLPTKGGSMKDQHSDIKEMFGVVEQVASAPQKFLSNFMKGKN